MVQRMFECFRAHLLISTRLIFLHCYKHMISLEESKILRCDGTQRQSQDMAIKWSERGGKMSLTPHPFPSP